jgi:cysteine desulfurase
LIYLDANATEPLRPAARAAVIATLDLVGNPSSIHRDGRAARSVLETARETVAACFGADPRYLIFTSGGTEANALAIHGLGRHRRILRGATEHAAVIATAGETATVLPVGAQGLVDRAELARLLALEPHPSLVCLMLANNETGTIQPIAEVAALCRHYKARLHVDATQAAGRIAVDLVSLGADSLALSAHKLGGPMGAGALVLAPDAAAELHPLIAGGGQERGLRGGTPALPAIAGFGAAAHEAVPADALRLVPLRDAMEAAAVTAGALVCGAGLRLPNTTCLALPGVRSEAQVIAFDLAGLSVSAGSACSSGKVARSHVLEAMGLAELAGHAIRVSLPWNAVQDHVAAFAEVYSAMAARAGRRAA